MISEIDKYISDKKLTPKLYRDAANKVATFDDDQWVAYDDADTFKLRSEYAQTKCLGGLMSYAITKDTANAKYSKALGAAAGRSSRVRFARRGNRVRV